MARMLHEQHDIAELFVTHLLSRNIRYEEDLVDQLFNSSEKRLARILLLLAHFGKESRVETILPNVNQESLAQMVGTTRSRVSHFMNKFRELGFVDYDGGGALAVNSGLLAYSCTNSFDIGGPCQSLPRFTAAVRRGTLRVPVLGVEGAAMLSALVRHIC